MVNAVVGGERCLSSKLMTTTTKRRVCVERLSRHATPRPLPLSRSSVYLAPGAPYLLSLSLSLVSRMPSYPTAYAADTHATTTGCLSVKKHQASNAGLDTKEAKTDELWRGQV